VSAYPYNTSKLRAASGRERHYELRIPRSGTRLLVQYIIKEQKEGSNDSTSLLAIASPQEIFIGVLRTNIFFPHPVKR
jgi:hypothetical protein